MEKFLKILYNSGIYLLISFALLLITNSIFWILGISLLKVSLFISFGLSIFICIYLLDGSLKNKIISIFISIIVLITSIFISGFIFDQSDDGNTYHKETIYMLKEGWNPVYDGYKEYAQNNDLTYNTLAKEIDSIIDKKSELEEMGRLASSIAPSNVEEKIYEEILKVIK